MDDIVIVVHTPGVKTSSQSQRDLQQHPFPAHTYPSEHNNGVYMKPLLCTADLQTSTEFALI